MKEPTGNSKSDLNLAVLVGKEPKRELLKPMKLSRQELNQITTQQTFGSDELGAPLIEPEMADPEREINCCGKLGGRAKCIGWLMESK